MAESEDTMEQEIKSSGDAEAQLKISDASDIHATRDEAVVEQLTRAKAEGSLEEEEDEEIDSALAELRASDTDEDEDEDEEEDETSDDARYFRRVIDKLNGKKSDQFKRLQNLLKGKIILNVLDCEEGYLFSFEREKLSVQHWEKTPPSNASCTIELTERHLEQILRGRLNPQIAMLSHKVHVSGESSQAVYFFNLFSR